MKDLRKRKPSIIVSEETLQGLKVGTIHLVEMPFTAKCLKFLPKGYPITDGRILVFPSKECPEVFSFRTKNHTETVHRETMNIMAYKNDDGSETLKIRLR